MKAIEAEKKELNILVSKGLTFDIEHTITRRKSFRKIKETEVLHFTIQEPTLSTLDRIAAEQIEMQIDEQAITSDSFAESRRMIVAHSRRLARIVALAVLGEEYNEKRLKELSDLFFHTIKPSKLKAITSIINLTGNLGDFMNSIRSMQVRTTMPDRIEEDEA